MRLARDVSAFPGRRFRVTTRAGLALLTALAVAGPVPVVLGVTASEAAAAGSAYVSFTPVSDGFTLAATGKAAPLYVDGQDFKGVVRVVDDLRDDVKRVTGAQPAVSTGTPTSG